jgi:hypothetical protein
MGAMVAAAGAAEAKSGGGKGGGGKGGGGNDGNFSQYIDDLAKFDTDDPPRYMRTSRGGSNDYLAGPIYFKERPAPVRAGCYARHEYYDWITGTDVVTYSGRQTNCR